MSESRHRMYRARKANGSSGAAVLVFEQKLLRRRTSCACSMDPASTTSSARPESSHVYLRRVRQRHPSCGRARTMAPLKTDTVRGGQCLLVSDHAPLVCCFQRRQSPRFGVLVDKAHGAPSKGDPFLLKRHAPDGVARPLSQAALGENHRLMRAAVSSTGSMFAPRTPMACVYE